MLKSVIGLTLMVIGTAIADSDNLLMVTAITAIGAILLLGSNNEKH